MTKHFSTREFYLSCFLYCKGVRLVEIRKLNGGNRCEFCFENSPVLQKLIADYWNGQGEVPPKAYAASIKELKNRLYTDSF